MIKRTIAGAFVGCTLLALDPDRTRAQGITTSALQGIVTDSSGAPIGGATVEAVHDSSASRYETVTRAGGRYTLDNLRVGGPYTVTVSHAGEVRKITGVFADLGQVTEVDIRLSSSPAPPLSAEPFTPAPGEPARVIVEASQVEDELFSPTRDGPSTTIFRQQIDALPSISRSLQDFTRLTPQVVGGSIASTNNRFNNITVDGATVMTSSVSRKADC